VIDVLRFDRSTGRTDSIAQLSMPRGERSGVRSVAGGMLQAFTNLPLAPRHDVFDAAGRVVERVVLAPGSRVVGFGRGTVYVARSDEDDLQHLELHRLP